MFSGTGSLVRPYWATLAMVADASSVAQAQRCLIKAEGSDPERTVESEVTSGPGGARIEMPLVRAAMVNWSSVPTPVASVCCSAAPAAGRHHRAQVCDAVQAWPCPHHLGFTGQHDSLRGAVRANANGPADGPGPSS